MIRIVNAKRKKKARENCYEFDFLAKKFNYEKDTLIFIELHDCNFYQFNF